MEIEELDFVSYGWELRFATCKPSRIVGEGKGGEDAGVVAWMGGVVVGGVVSLGIIGVVLGGFSLGVFFGLGGCERLGIWISLFSDAPVGTFPLSVLCLCFGCFFFSLWVVVRMGRFWMMWCILRMSSWVFCSGFFSLTFGDGSMAWFWLERVYLRALW